MITLDKDSLKARFFLRCLHAFSPFACGVLENSDGKVEPKKPEWYVENGTTLCHFFWVCFWLPLVCLGILSFFMMLIVAIHVTTYREYGTPGLFLPVGSVIGVILACAIIILMIIGADKAGLLAYLRALKERICPLITFGSRGEIP